MLLFLNTHISIPCFYPSHPSFAVFFSGKKWQITNNKKCQWIEAFLMKAFYFWKLFYLFGEFCFGLFESTKKELFIHFCSLSINFLAMCILCVFVLMSKNRGEISIFIIRGIFLSLPHFPVCCRYSLFDALTHSLSPHLSCDTIFKA